jgi:site-specific recombinase XerD
MSELVAAAVQDELLVLPRQKVRLHGIDFDEDFLSELVARHFRRQQWQTKPMFSDAFGIYMRENPSAHRRKFKTVAQQAYALFVAQFGDMPLDELRHVHITEFRESQLARGLHANSVRRHINVLNAMVNMAFKHLDMDRLSPFRRLYIRGEGELSRTMAPITVEHLRKVKAHLLSHPIPSRLAALIQLNTGMRISEPVLARLDDLVLDHDIPHLWVRKNSLTDRKIQASIRCVPLLGVSLEAAQELHRRAVRQKSDWLMPQYASEIGNTSCAATLNKYMRHLDFRTHMFRHAFINQLKGCGNAPFPIVEATKGRGRNSSEFARYGSEGYTLEQKNGDLRGF